MIKKRRHRRQESTEQAEYVEFAYVWIPSSTTTWVQNDGTEETRIRIREIVFEIYEWRTGDQHTYKRRAECRLRFIFQ